MLVLVSCLLPHALASPRAAPSISNAMSSSFRSIGIRMIDQERLEASKEPGGPPYFSYLESLEYDKDKSLVDAEMKVVDDVVDLFELEDMAAGCLKEGCTPDELKWLAQGLQKKLHRLLEDTDFVLTTISKLEAMANILEVWPPLLENIHELEADIKNAETKPAAEVDTIEPDKEKKKGSMQSVVEDVTKATALKDTSGLPHSSVVQPGVKTKSGKKRFSASKWKSRPESTGGKGASSVDPFVVLKVKDKSSDESKSTRAKTLDRASESFGTRSDEGVTVE